MTSTTGGPVPLTTTFTPPRECLNDVWIAYNSNGSIYMNLGPTTPLLCLPSGWGSSTYFSPGVCPSGYIIAANTTTAKGSAEETIATCCPVASGYTYSTRPSSTETFQWYSSAVCQWTPPPSVTTTFDFTYSTTIDSTYPVHYTTTTNVAVMNDTSGLVNAYGVEIRWQSTDFDSVPPTTTTGALAEPTKGIGESQTGLSSSAKIGTGVGVAIGSIVIFLVLGFFILRRRKLQGHSPDPSRDPYVELAEEPAHTQVKAELPATRPGNFVYQKPELGSNPVFEKEGSSRIDQHKPAELEG